MPRPRKDVPARVLDALPGAPNLPDSGLAQRIATLEADVCRLAGYIVERDQIRGIGPDADIVGIVRRRKA